jgi:uncharacterized protein YndB with AHSA1/START domain
MTYETAAELELRIESERRIDAPIADVWEALLVEVGPAFPGEDGNPISLELEAVPGGRWFRNLGDGAGHLWGHVQAIRPPTLLEITGPLFMSLPVANNVQYRLEEVDGVTVLRFVHAVFGPIPAGLGDEMSGGWADHLDRIGRHFG